MSQEKLEKYEKAIKYKIQKGIRKFNISLDSYKKKYILFSKSIKNYGM